MESATPAVSCLKRSQLLGACSELAGQGDVFTLIHNDTWILKRRNLSLKRRNWRFTIDARLVGKIMLILLGLLFWIRKPLYYDAASSCCGHAVVLSVFPTLVSRPIWRQFYSAGGGGGVVNQSEHFSPVSLCTLPTVVNQSGLIWRWCAPPREPICTNLAMRARLFCFFRFKTSEKDITTQGTPRL